MINIKTATSIIAGVAVAGVSIQQIITRTRKNAEEVVELEALVTNEASRLDAAFLAFNQAQDVISDRMLSGYYDDKTDAEANLDYQILYHTYLTK